jgi:hypothetical protein
VLLLLFTAQPARGGRVCSAREDGNDDTPGSVSFVHCPPPAPLNAVLLLLLLLLLL